MVYGHVGKVCLIDLTTGNITEEQLDEKTCRHFIGGEGLGAKFLLERQGARLDALGGENTLGFVAGLLAGCGISSAARTTVVTKSPLTGTFGDANVGGHFAPGIKACGYDALFFTGISSNPVYLWLTDDRAELRDATHLWGKDTVETAKALCGELGEPGLSIASIGPSGERRSLISSIIIDKRAAARSGVGAVMGSKRLKAIAVRGGKKVPLAEPDELLLLRRAYAGNLMKSDYFVIKTLRKYGTCGLVSLGTTLGLAPAKNWKLNGKKGFPGHSRLDSDEVVRYRTEKHGCSGCVIRCGGTVHLERGPYRGTETRLPEYETLVSFGHMCMNQDLESIIKAEDICDRFGIDTISTGAAIAFAIECFEKGLISKEDTGGIELTWGSGPAIVSLLEQVVKREEFGAILSDGVKRASERIGQGSEKFAVHIGGQEIPYHDFRYEPAGRGMTYISDPTPSRHERFTGGQLLQLGVALGPEAELQPGPEGDPEDYEALGRIYAQGTRFYEFFVSCGMCAFAMGVSPVFPLVDIIRAVTGWDFTAPELLETGERIQTLRQLFNIREGVKPDDFRFPDRMKEPPAFQGPMKGKPVDYDYHRLRETYFKAMQWNPQTGVPAKVRLKELGLDSAALRGCSQDDVFS